MDPLESLSGTMVVIKEAAEAIGMLKSERQDIDLKVDDRIAALLGLIDKAIEKANQKLAML